MHRLLVEPDEALEARRGGRDRRLDAARLGLANEAAVMPVHPLRRIAVVEPPCDRPAQRLDVHLWPAESMVREQRMETDE